MIFNTMGILKKAFGTSSKKSIKKITPIVDKIESLEPSCKALSDKKLRAKTDAFKKRLREGETLEDILPEAFAVCREASYRVLGMRPYRVQLIGGIILHQGRIAEMYTGEGKTLVAALPAYLNALSGEGVHIITVNDYLAKRDSEQIGKIFRFLGLRVGLISQNMQTQARKAAYAADITYGTNNEFGFDYLRDNMAKKAENVVQRGLPFAIVDEVDSILIDEARTPLIISGNGEQSSELYVLANIFAKSLTPYVVVEMDPEQFDEQIDTQYDYVVEEKTKSAVLTSSGIAKAESFFHVENLADEHNTALNHYINQAIRAHGVMKKDVDYVVKDGEVIIVDESTGRLMFGRRFNDGLHQAIEAKEEVGVQKETTTLATITFQNFFCLYNKLSGMTGTAITEEQEFNSIYKLDVVEIPTNKPVIRKDNPDAVFKTEAGKFKAVVRQIKKCHEKQQPILIGTISVEKSEQLSKLLVKEGIPHNVLNAKNHEKEAEIIAQAGVPGAVTVATNMAGRGTDILLGGNPDFLASAELKRLGFNRQVVAQATGYVETDDPEILAARAKYIELREHYKQHTDSEAEKVCAIGGLYVLGTERHESRRIDNQLRGRSGRQGDPGESQFFLSLEDDILRIFGSQRIQKMMDALKIEEDEPIDIKMLSSIIENAQMRVESKNFQARKNVLDYDSVMNVQRETFYKDRRAVLEGSGIGEIAHNMISDTIEKRFTELMGEQTQLTSCMLQEILEPYRNAFLAINDFSYSDEELKQMKTRDVVEAVKDKAFTVYAQKEQIVNRCLPGEDGMRTAEQMVMLTVVDECWINHLEAMERLKESVQLQTYAQADPVVAYKRAGFNEFESMTETARFEIVQKLFSFRLRNQPVQAHPVANPAL